MKIILISDTHSQHGSFKLPEGDMVIHAGDFSKRGREEEVREFLDWYAALPHPHKVLIAGNHDFLAEREPEKFRGMLPENIHYLEDEEVVIEGIRIWGSPITPWFYDWAFNRHRGPDIARHWDPIPLNTDILVTHGPPYGILDKVIPRNEWVGCRDLMEKIAEVRPKLHVFGHIHEGYGQEKVGETHFVNASLLDIRYRPVNLPIVFNFSE